ncbi:MAG TPA: mechanosensitive ion channel domain-containing protein [Bryobacteraceae bacterium]|nr:mechanosensitive ion channel domain-containing protein [Bryobacteraceae bacterium]
MGSLVRRLLPAVFLAAALAPAQEPVTDDEVIEYVGHVIAWYRDAAAATQGRTGSREALYRDSVRKSASQTLRSALQFARAQAALPSGGPAAPAADDTRGRRLLQAGANAAQRIDQIEEQIESIDRSLESAPARTRARLAAKRNELTGELNLARARRESLQGLAGLLNNSDNGGLSARISDLERSVSDLDAAAAPREQPDDFHPESAGVVGLTSEVFSISRKISRLDDLSRATERLREHLEKFRAPMRTSLRNIMRRSEAISQMPDTDPAALNEARKELDGLLVRFKQLSSVSAPLAAQTADLRSTQADLVQWRNVLGQQSSGIFRYLLFRLVMLGLGILVILLLSALWRRGTMRYVQDMRRRRQLLLLRRIVVGCTIAVFILLSFVTEFGSIATFAGFSAAGIAVAMQSVILSVVAYFFLVGRWGVRVGDRITVSGVTGDVIDIGLFRVYLMELAKVGQDTQATGRVVVFPNAVFFQPSALFKQFPGIEYTWRSVSLTLPPYGDYSALEKEVLAAVEAVYEEYRGAIEKQHRAAQSADNLHTPSPRPEARLRLVEGGLEFSVRYPVELRRAAETDDRITRALLAVLDHHPTVTFSRGPKVQAVIG